MDWWDWDVFFGEWEPTIRGWVIALGGGIALFFGTRTYLMNARTKREAQARLVYAKMGLGGPVEKGTIRLGGRKAADPTLATTGHFLKVLDEDAAEINFFVVNGSEELLGPLELTVFHVYDKDDVVSLTIREEVLEPDSQVELFAIVRDEITYAPTHFLLRFRDSSGLWWERAGMHPIKYLGRKSPIVDVPKG